MQNLKHRHPDAVHTHADTNPSFLLPEQPQPPKQPAMPMIYVDEKLEFEYKRLVYDMEEDGPPDENTLDLLGKEGWELVGIIGHKDNGYFYFKRVKK